MLLKIWLNLHNMSVFEYEYIAYFSLFLTLEENDLIFSN